MWYILMQKIVFFWVVVLCQDFFDVAKKSEKMAAQVR